VLLNLLLLNLLLSWLLGLCYRNHFFGVHKVMLLKKAGKTLFRVKDRRELLSGHRGEGEGSVRVPCSKEIRIPFGVIYMLVVEERLREGPMVQDRKRVMLFSLHLPILSNTELLFCFGGCTKGIQR